MLDSLLLKVNGSFANRDKTTIKNFLIICLCVLKQESVNLKKLASVVGDFTDKRDTTKDSNYKRLTRFFCSIATVVFGLKYFSMFLIYCV